MFWVIDDKYRKDIAEIAVKERLSKKTILNPSNIYYLMDGLCVLNHLTEKGDEKTIVYFIENSLMGFFPFLLKFIISEHKVKSDFGRQHGYIIKTRSACQVLRIDGDRFFSLLGKRPNLLKSVICALTQNYLNTNELLVEISHSPAPVRVCRMIHEFRKPYNGRTILSPHLTYYDIGTFTGLHPITVTKVFKALFCRGILSKKGKIITITNQELLVDIIRNKEVLTYKKQMEP